METDSDEEAVFSDDSDEMSCEDSAAEDSDFEDSDRRSDWMYLFHPPTVLLPPSTNSKKTKKKIHETEKEGDAAVVAELLNC